MITEVYEIKPIQLSAKSSIYRNVFKVSQDEGCTCNVTITKIFDDQPWWYRACNACPNKQSMQLLMSSCRGSTDVILRYKLTFMASDGTTKMHLHLQVQTHLHGF